MTRAAIYAALAFAATTGARASEDAAATAGSGSAIVQTGSDATKPPATPPAEPIALNELPALPNDPTLHVAMRGTPASLPPVSAQIFRIGGKIEFQPIVQFSIGDPFYRSVLAGVRLERHLDERWSFSGHALGGASLLSAPIDVCTDASCTNPEAGQLRSTPGDIRLMAGVELGWAPIYGKLSLAGEKTPPRDALVSVVSRWPKFLEWAHVFLVAAGVETDALDLRDARAPGWERGLRSSAHVITDALTARTLPSDVRARVYRVVADSSLEELRSFVERFLTGAAADAEGKSKKAKGKNQK